ncbi:MAG: phosphoglucosamine mutase [Bacteroidales bacterium]
MTLITSISGIRGTIGGVAGKGLTPEDIVKFVSAYATLISEKYPGKKKLIVIGRDARVSGDMVSRLVSATLIGMGIDISDLGLTTTPTVEMAVNDLKAVAGIIITASHNPGNWNALKFLDEKGEFISAALGEEILEKAKQESIHYAEVEKLGKYTVDESQLDKHIAKILKVKLVDVAAIKKAKFHIVVDAVNSTGGIAVPRLLKALGVEQVTELFCEPDGQFAHNPEPLPENLEQLSEMVVKTHSHAGFAVDPDVDRLAIVCENGDMFGEEYTLVAVADYILQHKKGNVVSNLSSTQALKDIAARHNQQYFASAVGEVNVVSMMKKTKAVIGGEGNGGVILPELHYGRDALVGIALFLTYLAKSGKRCSSLRDTYPSYSISKNKITLSPEIDVDLILRRMKEQYQKQPLNDIDGLKIEFGKEWVHLRKSNTEPIIRIYSESDSLSKAEILANKIISDIREIIKG